MAVAVLKNRLFEDRQIPTAGGELLHAKLMLPKPPIVPRRVVLISPLVGAGAAQPLLIFRNLTRRGSILLSFEYRGHRHSDGQFELDNTLVDVQHAILWAWNYASQQKLPLHGFATCYGAVPLLAQFTTPGPAWMLASINFTSGLFRLDQILRFEDFATHLAARLGRKLSRQALLAELRKGSIDCNGTAFRGALLNYLSGLFPQLRVGSDYFEELQYARTRIPETLLQLSQARYLDGVNVPPEIPCNVFCGRNDALLGLDTRQGCAAYRDRVLSLVPHAAIHERQFDHFGRGPEHDRVIDHLSDIFERYDEPGIPAPKPRALQHDSPRELEKFWTDRYSVERPLELDSWGRRVVNRHIVAALMNNFPRTATRFFSLSRGKLARLLFVEREGGSYRVLRAMYEHENAGGRGDLINRLIMQSPAIKAARNRRTIAQRMLEKSLCDLPAEQSALLVAIGGGDGRLEAEVLARVPHRKIYLCVVDKDQRAVEENQKVLEEHGLERRGFVFPRLVSGNDDLEVVVGAANRRFGVALSGADVTACHGIAEYLDVGSSGNDMLAGFLAAIHAWTRPEGKLIISQTDHHDRETYLERGLQWHMRLRSAEELAAEVENAGWTISVCQREPMQLITLCLAVKSAARPLRIDARRRLAQSRAGRPSPGIAPIPLRKAG